MFVFNVSLTKNKMLKFSIVVVAFILLIIALVFFSKKSKSDTYIINEPSSLDINSNNYTSVLDTCYKNPESYIGKKIKFTGFVFRLFDFKDNQFVLAREMIVDNGNDSQAKVVVVGFLCEYDKALKFPDGTWVEVEGLISKGNYHSETPIVKVLNITPTTPPEDPYVFPPNKNFLITEKT